MEGNNGNGNGNGKSNGSVHLSEEARQHLRRAGVSTPTKTLLKDAEIKEQTSKKIETPIQKENKPNPKPSIPYYTEIKHHYKRAGRVKPVYSNSLQRRLTQFVNWSGILDKKGLDLMTSLVIALGLPMVTLAWNNSVKESESQRTLNKERQEALVSYIDNVPKLIYNLEATPKSNSQDVPLSLMQAKTRSTLQLLEGDPRRRDVLITFLKESGLLYKLRDDNNYLNIPEKLRGAILQHISLRRIDLSQAELSYANLAESDLTKANLQSSHFNWADLSNARLSGADLRNQKISLQSYLIQLITGQTDPNLRTTLINANLRGAFLNEAKLNGADLSGANLIGANLEYAKWDSKTNFKNTLYNKETKLPPELKAYIHKQDRDKDEKDKLMIEVKSSMEQFFDEDDVLRKDALSKTDLSDLNLANSNLTGANLSFTKLKKTYLSNSTLDEVDFTGTNLSETDLTNATLKNANLTDADLRGSTTLTEGQLLEASLCRTKLPPKFDKQLDKDRDCPKETALMTHK